jgi:hypothetical protein
LTCVTEPATSGMVGQVQELGDFNFSTSPAMGYP